MCLTNKPFMLPHLKVHVFKCTDYNWLFFWKVSMLRYIDYYILHLGWIEYTWYGFWTTKGSPPLAPCTSHSNSISKVEQINMTMVVFKDTSLESLFIATSIHAIKTWIAFLENKIEKQYRVEWNNTFQKVLGKIM